MNKKSLILFVGICASTALYTGTVQATALNFMATRMVMPGGYQFAPVNDPQVKQAADVAAQALGSRVRTIYSAYTQVVAGTNYKINFLLTNGQRYEVVVFRDLNGQYRTTAINFLPTNGTQPTPPPPPKPMLGGSGGVSVNDPGVVAAAKFVESRINRGRLIKIDHAERQIVKGTRYTLDLEFQRGHYNATVLYSLDGSHAITSISQHQ